MEPAVKQKRRGVGGGTPTNPTRKVVDIREAAKTAHSARAALFVDNTFASPINQKPLDLGADVSLESATKYLNGHSDAVGGVVTAREDDVAARVRAVQNSAGAIMGPVDAFPGLGGRRGGAAAAGAAATATGSGAGGGVAWLGAPPLLATGAGRGDSEAGAGCAMGGGAAASMMVGGSMCAAAPLPLLT